MVLLLSLAAALGAAPQGPPPQGVEYRIEASLDEETSVLRGRARLRYTNRSDLVLDTLWFHQHLNAFRPNSAWARRELEYGERRFQALGPTEHAYERFRRVAVGGREVRPLYPIAPDSTVVAIPLPSGLRPGETAELLMDWDARLSTLPRRQGRQGRHFDFAQWYPRIAVFENGRWQTQPLLPQGEFYGEFASYDVTLELREDQVVGSTGVPVEGDPGWRGAAVNAAEAVRLQRGVYGQSAAEPLHLLARDARPGWKRVRWRAENVHHFAWSADPTFRYEGGEMERIGRHGEGPIALHVLYLPGDTAWDDGVALERTRRALGWLQELFGGYPWPQLTNLHRIERGGTEFPMLMMNGSASQGLIAHETAHQYVHGILANNEWREGWLDEGFASFLDLWFLEEEGEIGTYWEDELAGVREVERAGGTQPVATPGAEFTTPALYSALTYAKTNLVLRMLRDLVGEDQMRAILREYYRRHALEHVTEADLRRVVNDVTGEDLDWFFEQWLHTTATLDYAVAGARAERLAGGRWRTRVEVVRRGDAWMPVTLQVDGEARELTSREARQTVEVVTDERPREVVLDPGNVLLDLDPANNRRRL